MSRSVRMAPSGIYLIRRRKRSERTISINGSPDEEHMSSQTWQLVTRPNLESFSTFNIQSNALPWVISQVARNLLLWGFR
jgi:hypothetical protein